MIDKNAARSALRALMPGETAEDALLDALIVGACETLCALTNRSALPACMAGLAVRLALVRYSLMGMEGETERREGSMTVKAEDIPSALRREILSWRIARVMG